MMVIAICYCKFRQQQSTATLVVTTTATTELAIPPSTMTSIPVPPAGSYQVQQFTQATPTAPPYPPRPDPPPGACAYPQLPEKRDRNHEPTEGVSYPPSLGGVPYAPPPGLPNPQATACYPIQPPSTQAYPPIDNYQPSNYGHGDESEPPPPSYESIIVDEKLS